ncbi:hypothetical protein BUALT_Bualt02G0012200 [Buddleja alternifolia]|uniref:Bifunctional inhibitor/plant lipid transfer protein/seed storage helical domain-containing protein n=1 Tax=Buddleja alternifolia TaxID=168488 RepID=A0AAV6Y3M7_9LAMI|nr:hypothetical protein BUALT_Bualt02G0012200 [Buddleja alternifolia]
MESKQKFLGLFLPCILALLFSFARCDVDKDKEKCANDLVGLATCLSYVSGESKSPPIDCCTGLKQVLQKSPECLCLLIKDRNDPSLGLKINATLALGLPSQCHAPAASISNCPALLHLAPNSPDAKVFEDFAKSAKKSNATAAAVVGNSSSGTATATTTDQKGDGGKKKRLFGIEMISGFLLTMVVVHNLPNLI